MRAHHCPPEVCVILGCLYPRSIRGSEVVEVPGDSLDLQEAHRRGRGIAWPLLRQRWERLLLLHWRWGCVHIDLLCLHGDVFSPFIWWRHLRRATCCHLGWCWWSRTLHERLLRVRRRRHWRQRVGAAHRAEDPEGHARRRSELRLAVLVDHASFHRRVPGLLPSGAPIRLARHVVHEQGVVCWSCYRLEEGQLCLHIVHVHVGTVAPADYHQVTRLPRVLRRQALNRLRGEGKPPGELLLEEAGHVVGIWPRVRIVDVNGGLRVRHQQQHCDVAGVEPRLTDLVYVGLARERVVHLHQARRKIQRALLRRVRLKNLVK